MRSALVALSLLVAGLCWADGPTLSNAADIRKLADSAMNLIAQDKVDEAFAKLAPYWPMPENELTTLVLKTVQQRNLVEPRFGKTLGIEFLGEEHAGDFGVRFTYVERRERHVLRWRFVFYKPKDCWIVNSVFWDDQIGELFRP